MHEFSGSALETKNTRRTTRQHGYLSLKDELLSNRLDSNRKSNIWTSIGFIFADGAVTDGSVQIVITEDDSIYLSNNVLPSLLDERIINNVGPKLISAHSNSHPTSFSGSKPVSRLHIEDSVFASFIQSLGMPPNKTTQGLDIGELIRELPDRYFYCFLCGLFDGDGSISHGPIKQFALHLDFDLHSEAICQTLKKEIEQRSSIPMRVTSHPTDAGKQHFKLSATTTPRALSLIACMYYYSGFQLSRKVTRADELTLQLQRAVPSYTNMPIRLSMLAKKTATTQQFNELLSFLRERMITQNSSGDPCEHPY